MEYCTVDQVLKLLKADAQDIILGDQYLEDEADKQRRMRELTESAIEDADAEMNGYLAKRYELPFPDNPPILNKLGKDIAIYNLFSRIGIEEDGREKNYLTRYQAAIRFLEAVGTGKIELGIRTPEQAAHTGFCVQSPERIFSRDSLKGW